jgi:hypothetical protein
MARHTTMSIGSGCGAIRGLLWAWDSAVSIALRDESWRVREMAAKVARHLVGDALPAVVELRDDPVPRVRAAAQRERSGCSTKPMPEYLVAVDAPTEPCGLSPH